MMVIDELTQASKIPAKVVMTATARMVIENVVDRTGLLRDNLIDRISSLCFLLEKTD
jgi:hypothetical protein